MTQTVDNIGELFADLNQAVQDADYSETLEAFMPRMAEQEAGMFAGEFDSNLEPWAPLKPSTIKRKGHDRILVESGDLRKSLVSVGGPGNISEVAPKGMLFGTDVEYASFLQEGTSRMPARPPVGISVETLDKLCDAVADATIEMLRG